MNIPGHTTHHVQPAGIQLGDVLATPLALRKVIDMRAVGPGREARLLTFSTGELHLAREQELIYRPIAPAPSIPAHVHTPSRHAQARP